VISTRLEDNGGMGGRGADSELVGGTPRISDIATADFDASDLEAIARAR
jgi:hypothetical protein